jgi:hypothetical protein
MVFLLKGGELKDSFSGVKESKAIVEFVDKYL